MSTTNKVILIIIALIVFTLAVWMINAGKYSMVVNVVEGENVMGVNPTTERLDFGDLSQNNGMTRYVNLQSGGRISTYIMAFKFGEIADLITLSDNFFTLKGGEEKQLGFAIHIPPSAEIRQYKGWAIVFRIPRLF